ncbi:MAG: hypothetical protein EBR82_45295 [Caulobacteraceae bacterium]|jgi:hypothetical protein|nr:hypothetical protein [Caulobacteraceae bacterium]
MSNDLVSILATNPSIVQTGLDEDTLAVAGGNRQGNKRLSIKGGVFRKYTGGKEIGAIEDRHMNVIIVKMAHKASRMYYDQGYKEGEKVSPVCWSNDSETPDPAVKNPPASACNNCPNSAKGSSDNGVSAKCRLSWRTAVVLPNDPSGDVMQLVLPATSAFGKEDNGRWPFRPYVQHLASHNVSAGRVITKMQFDTKSPTPKLLFSPVGAVSEDDLEVIARQAKSPAAEAAIKLNVYQMDSEEEGSGEAAPTKREVSNNTEAKSVDVSDVVKKWAKK